MNTIDRHQVKRDQTELIIEQSQKYLQERKTKKSQLDVNGPASADVSDFGPHMNTIDHRKDAEAFLDNFDPMKDEALKRTIDQRKSSLNADLRPSGSSEINGLK